MIRLLAVGKVRGVLEPAVAAYEARVGHYWRFEAVEVAAGVGRGGQAEPDAVRRAEAERLLSNVPDDAELWIVTREGKALDSVALARTLGARQLHAAPLLVLALGGAFGFDPRVTERAARRLSLSAMTLPHEMARLVLVEQLYRAGTILRNEPYHKGTR
jgi:23S rRNA (pseudouridine1915-N3)-methyltransferase